MKREIFAEIHNKTNVSPKAAEKDWWVCHAIKSIFEMRCADALTFKGGTSLSKAWGVSNRFSEDVDISIDKAFFGLFGTSETARCIHYLLCPLLKAAILATIYRIWCLAIGKMTKCIRQT